MKKIVTFTINPALDISVTTGCVVPNLKLRCALPHFQPGGGGINVSRAIKRLGGTSVVHSTAGGVIGQKLVELLQKERITYYVHWISGMTRISLSVFEETSRQQYRFVMPGPRLIIEEWQACLEKLFNNENKPDYIVASGSLPRSVPIDLYGRLARLAREAGTCLIVDTSGEALKAAVKEGVYLLKPNMRELAHLAGYEIEDKAQQEKVIRSIIEDGQADVVVVSLGAAGALLMSKDGMERIPAPTVKIKSKVGAGDSMVAGIVLGLAQGMTLRQATYFGVAAGTAAVMTSGSELCRREDTQRLYDEMISNEM
jgi:6-phosphofructokinase 2